MTKIKVQGCTLNHPKVQGRVRKFFPKRNIYNNKMKSFLSLIDDKEEDVKNF